MTNFGNTTQCPNAGNSRLSFLVCLTPACISWGEVLFLRTGFCLGKADACEPVGMWANRNIPRQVSVSISGFPWLLLVHKLNFLKTVSHQHFFFVPCTMCSFAPRGANFRKPEPFFQKYHRIQTFISSFKKKKKRRKLVINNYKISSVLREECFTQYTEHTVIS